MLPRCHYRCKHHCFHLIDRSTSIFNKKT